MVARHNAMPQPAMTTRVTRLSPLLIGLLLAPVAAQQPASVPQGERPVFRSGVSLVTMDVTVLDRNRKPVHGLTGSDFIVTEDGIRQPVTTWTEILVPPPDLGAVSWVREVGTDVVTNSLDSRRLVVIILNDGEIGPIELQLAKVAAHAVIDQLGPSDLAAVVKSDLGRMENFTTNRTALRAAVDELLPRRGQQRGAAGAYDRQDVWS